MNNSEVENGCGNVALVFELNSTNITSLLSSKQPRNPSSTSKELFVRGEKIQIKSKQKENLRNVKRWQTETRKNYIAEYVKTRY